MSKEIILAKMAKDPPIKATTMARTVNGGMSCMGLHTDCRSDRSALPYSVASRKTIQHLKRSRQCLVKAVGKVARGPSRYEPRSDDDVQTLHNRVHGHETLTQAL